MKLKGAVFDLDGTLVDTELLQFQAWKDVLAEQDITLEKDKWRQCIGKAPEAILVLFSLWYDLKGDSAELLRYRQTLVTKLFEKHGFSMTTFGLEAVQFFLDKGIKISIASNGPIEDVMEKIEKSDLVSIKKQFSAIVSLNDVEKGKPAPDMYATAAEKMGLSPEECIGFEDNAIGLASIKAAGLTAVVVPHEFSKHQDFSQADGVFADLREAIEWVTKNYNL
jgi:beta-phosphoglucomutase